MIFLGDIHGDHHFAKSIAARYPKDKVIQVGDFGVGLISSDELNENFPDNLYFFCGNHDKRREAPMIKGLWEILENLTIYFLLAEQIA